MADHRQEIPSWAFIDAQIVQKAIRTQQWAQCVRAVEEQYGWQPGTLGNGLFYGSHLASLLYCLIVVPKEVWLLSKNHIVYDTIDDDWLRGLFAVELVDDVFQYHPVYYLIHHLRNAVAHANFAFDDDLRLTFWDQKNKTSEPYFRASISRECLEEFLSKVGTLLANLKARRTNG